MNNMNTITKVGICVGSIAVIGGISFGLYKYIKSKNTENTDTDTELKQEEVNPVGMYATLKNGKYAYYSPTSVNTNNPTFSLTGKIGKIEKEVEGYSNLSGVKDGSKWYLVNLTSRYKYTQNNTTKYATKVYVKVDDITLSSK